MKKLVLPETTDSTSLVNTLRDLIRQSRQQVLRSVDTIQVQTYWQIGRHIVEFEQGGQARADYGKRLLSNLADALTQEFGKGFDERNLRNMRAFFQCFPNWNAVRSELSWTHYRLLLRVDSAEARNWYMDETAGQNWSTRVLERQIGTLFYERLLSSKDKQRLLEDSREQMRSEIGSPRDFVRDPVMLEFLGVRDLAGLLESDLEQALMNKLQQFLLELGKGFAFVARQQRVSTETQDFYIDLVFYNYVLKCFVLIDLKTGHLSHQDIGQMDMYVRLYDDLRRGEGDNPTVGILLCGSRDHSVVRYSVLHESEHLFASKYRLVLPSEEELRRELDRETQAAQARQSE
ncbi:putative nuclease of restriction endonuclease-like (RecB) superfamily [Desulfomicrobium macestii]|uniref:Nuclease of restriction endonuclease-like (RecB) superfamily n=1 Tax=Desulfomicrobium macestii TaxID=90731 RepID=A0ABR9H2G4_9BACT|nr:PDDEXK nuclease domain-containing protein [Desulfomicrobium macestii]MBE1424899.1 putative nuclease of restriction endonuclease-like (RecB) superfamily [Desulfomicrobium macestii]